MASQREIRNKKFEIRNSFDRGVSIEEICRKFNITFEYFTKCLFPNQRKILKERMKTERSLSSLERTTEVSPRESEKNRRLYAIVQMMSDGMTMQQVGERLGLSRERVRQILRNRGYSVKEFRQERVKSQEGLKIELNAWVAKHPGCRIDEIAARFDLRDEDVDSFLTRNVKRFVLSPKSSFEERGVRKFSEDDVLNALRTAFRLRNPMMGLYAHQDRLPITGPYYEQLRLSGQVFGPSEARIIQIFGSWRNACELAGIESKLPVRASYVSTWTHEELTDFVAQFLLESENSSTKEFDAWCRDEESRPSSGTIRNKFGTWENAKREALLSLRKAWEHREVAED